MTKSSTGEQKSTDKANEPMTLSEAVRIVREAIRNKEHDLERAANGDFYGPVPITGLNAEGEEKLVLASPEEVGRIMLDCKSPIFTVLGEDEPQEMWDRLARLTGLKEIYYVEIYPREKS